MSELDRTSTGTEQRGVVTDIAAGAAANAITGGLAAAAKAAASKVAGKSDKK